MAIDWPSDAAGWAALLTVAVVALWKLYLRVRRDHRIDSLESLGRAAEVHVAGHYTELFAQLQLEVQRMRDLIEEERAARRAAETEAADLRTRVFVLERQVRALGATPH